MKFSASVQNVEIETGEVLRALTVDELNEVAGGAGGSTVSSSSFQGGGNDGFGGGRRNP